MNWIQKQIVKALNSSTLASKVNQALFKFVGSNMPIWMEYNVENYIKQGYERNADFFAVINKIVGLAVSVPWELVKVNQDGEEEIIKEHPILDVWKMPNETQGNAEFLSELLTFRLVTGNGYVHGMGPTNGKNANKWQSLYIMPSQHVRVHSNGWRKVIDHYTLELSPDIQFPVEEVLHLRSTNLEYENGQSLYGMSPVTAAAKAITSSNAGYEAKVSAYQSGGMKGFISGDGNDITISKEQIDALKATLKRVSQKQDFHVTNVPLRWNEMGLSPVDLAILDSLKMDRATICNIYGISDILFNSDSANTYNNYAQAKKSAYTEVIQPLLKNLQDCLHQWWIVKYGEDLIFRPDYSDIEVLQDNMVEKSQWLATSWWITINEKREQMGYQKIDDPMADIPLIPTGLMPLTDFSMVDQMDESLVQLGLREYGSRNTTEQKRIPQGKA